MVRDECSRECRACSYVDHWLLGTSDPSRPRRTSQSLSGLRSRERPGRRRHHRDPDRAGCSLLCFEEAVISATSTKAERASCSWSSRTRIVWSSHDLDVPQPRNLHGFGATLENCIASTSVLKEVAPCSFLPRRVEECAISSYKEPTVDALAPGADEGRGWLRKATGSCLPSFDPWIIRMGKPGWGNAQSLLPEYIGQREGTGGIETSQYPEEEKTTVTP